MEWIQNIYYHIRLWYWWHFYINRDEFSNKLSLSYYYFHKHQHFRTSNHTCIRARVIAHKLAMGISILDIPLVEIKLADI